MPTLRTVSIPALGVPGFITLEEGDLADLGSLTLSADLDVAGDATLDGSAETPILLTDASADTAAAGGAWTFGGTVTTGAVTVNDDLTVEGDNVTLIATDFSADSVTIEGSTIIIANLPTSDPNVAGQLWANNNVLTVSAGA